MARTPRFRHDSVEGRHLVRVHRPLRHGRDVDSAAAVTGTAQVNPDFATKLDGVHQWSLSMLDLVEDASGHDRR